MLTPEQRKHLAIFANGGESADKALAQAAARAYLNSGTVEAGEMALAQLKSQFAAYDDTPDGHKTNHDEIAEALFALISELTPAPKSKKSSS